MDHPELSLEDSDPDEPLNRANPAHTAVLAVDDLASCPDAIEMERARTENKAIYSGRLLHVFVRYR
jgi:hypothetical protein